MELLSIGVFLLKRVPSVDLSKVQMPRQQCLLHLKCLKNVFILKVPILWSWQGMQRKRKQIQKCNLWSIFSIQRIRNDRMSEKYTFSIEQTRRMSKVFEISSAQWDLILRIYYRKSGKIIFQHTLQGVNKRMAPLPTLPLLLHISWDLSKFSVVSM